MCRTAKLAGYDLVLEASSGREGLALAAAHRPDAIVLDVKLKDYDGFEVCRRLKSKHETAAASIVMITSMYYSQKKPEPAIEAGRQKAKAAGALDLLPRGDALDSLKPLLEKILKTRPIKRGSEETTA